MLPLSDFTRKGKPNKVDWGDGQENAYQTLKTILASESILHLPDPKKTYHLRTDTTDYGVDTVLMQENDSKLFPVCYASKKLSDAERNYFTIEKECLAIVWALQSYNIRVEAIKGFDNVGADYMSRVIK